MRRCTGKHFNRTVVRTWSCFVFSPLGPFHETGTIDRVYFVPWQFGRYHDDRKWRCNMRRSAENHALQGGYSIFRFREMKPLVYQMPRLKILVECDPSSSATGPELIERALSTLPTDDTESVAMKNRFRSWTTMMMVMMMMMMMIMLHLTRSSAFLVTSTACGEGDHRLILCKLSAPFRAAPWEHPWFGYDDEFNSSKFHFYLHMARWTSLHCTNLSKRIQSGFVPVNAYSKRLLCTELNAHLWLHMCVCVCVCLQSSLGTSIEDDTITPALDNKRCANQKRRSPVLSASVTLFLGTHRR